MYLKFLRECLYNKHQGRKSSRLKNPPQKTATSSNEHFKISETEGNSGGWDETERVVKRKNVLSALSEHVDSSQAGDSSRPR